MTIQYRSLLLLPAVVMPLLIGCGGGSSGDTTENTSSVGNIASSAEAFSSSQETPISSAPGISSQSASSVPSEGQTTLSKQTGLYVRETPNGDQIVAVDTSSGTAVILQDFQQGGGANITDMAISPDRKTIAIGAHYQLTDADLVQGIPSEAIWLMNADGSGLRKLQAGFPASGPGFYQPCSDNTVCQQINAQTVCGTSGLCQLAGQTNTLDDLAWSPDGQDVWYTITQMSSPSTGGSAVGWTPATGGDPTLLPQFCQLQSNPAPAADGRIFFHGALCGNETSDMLIVTPSKTSQSPSIVLQADNVGGIYAGSLGQFGIKMTQNGTVLFSLGRADINQDSQPGYTIAEYNPANGNLGALPEVDAPIAGFAASPDLSQIVACFNDNPNALQYNLYLMDLTVQNPQWRAVTDDGVSCEPAW